jgi:hypothetical protein
MLIISLFLLAPGAVFAETAESAAENLRLVNSDDYSEVVSLLDEGISSFLSSYEIGEVMYGKAYAEVAHQPDGGAVINSLIIDAYYSGNSFRENIRAEENGIRWQIPYSNGSLATIQRVDGAFQILGVSGPVRAEFPVTVGYTDIDLVRQAIEESSLIDPNNIEELLFVADDRYIEAYAYVRSDGVEYLIPRGANNPHFSGLENYTIYTVEEAMPVLIENFEWEPWDGEPVLADGGGSNDANKTVSWFIAMIIISLATIAVVAIAVVFIRKRKSMNGHA